MVDRAANKRRFLAYKRDYDNEADMPDTIPLTQNADGSFATPTATPTPDKALAKGVESVEDIYYKVGEAVDRLMRVAAVTLAASDLKLDSGPNAATVVSEIESVQQVLEDVKAKIAAEKAIKAAVPEPAPIVATPEPSAASIAIANLEELAKRLKVEKAGAAMSANRLKRFSTALTELANILAEVGGDTEKSISTNAQPPIAPVTKGVAEAVMKAELDALRREVATLKRAPAVSQAMPAEHSTQAGTTEDFAWPADMNKPLGRNDVPADRSFY